MMQTNILKAISNIIKYNLYSLEKYRELNYKIRINNAGESLENLIKDVLSDNLVESNHSQTKIELQNNYFSYLGNQNNPPDLIIRNGDALEIKKIETNAGNIALNSSFPKDKLYRDSNMITKACKNCEDDWQEKDICYVIGCVDKEQFFKNLWFIYGDCYCAKPDIYTRIKSKITSSIEELGIELHKTNEIAKVKNCDPLGVTDLRVRGMWAIKHPSKVFQYVTEQNKNHVSSVNALMLKTKFNSFSNDSKQEISKLTKINQVKIHNPNNPANLLDAVLIQYDFVK